MLAQMARPRRRPHRSRPPSRSRSDSAPTGPAGIPPAAAPLRARRTVFVLGAGVDIAMGMPTMRSLIADLAHFARSDGAEIHAVLRRKLPYLRFSFDKFAGDQRDGVLRRLFDADTTLAGTLESIRSKLPDTPTMQALSVLIGRLGQLARHNLLYGDDLKKIQATSEEDLGETEPMLDPGRITLSDAPNQTLRKGLQEALRNEAALTSAERGALEELIDATSNIEQLLALYFVRFLAGSPADQRTYLYLVWMLWAFLRSRSATAKGQETSLYPRLASLADAVITFNYTPFISQVTPAVGQVTFFHGRLDQYLAPFSALGRVKAPIFSR